jgi:hypothetical protein
MGNTLNKDSIMECPFHGEKPPTFICQHLQYGYGLGFNQPDDPPDPEWPFENAWCDECDSILLKECGWNDISEGFAGILPICLGCFQEIKKRNIRP